MKFVSLKVGKTRNNRILGNVKEGRKEGRVGGKEDRGTNKLIDQWAGRRKTERERGIDEGKEGCRGRTNEQMDGKKARQTDEWMDRQKGALKYGGQIEVIQK